MSSFFPEDLGLGMDSEDELGIFGELVARGVDLPPSVRVVFLRVVQL